MLQVVYVGLLSATVAVRSSYRKVWQKNIAARLTPKQQPRIPRKTSTVEVSFFGESSEEEYSVVLAEVRPVKVFC